MKASTSGINESINGSLVCFPCVVGGARNGTAPASSPSLAPSSLPSLLSLSLAIHRPPPPPFLSNTFPLVTYFRSSSWTSSVAVGAASASSFSTAPGLVTEAAATASSKLDIETPSPPQQHQVPNLLLLFLSVPFMRLHAAEWMRDLVDVCMLLNELQFFFFGFSFVCMHGTMVV